MRYYDTERLRLYRGSVTWFCCYLTQYIRLSRQQEKGLPASKRKRIFCASMVRQYRNAILEDKAVLGLGGGISFIGDHHFKDFSIIDFEIVGDKTKVYPTVMKSINGFPDHASHYDYEVGMFALAVGWSDQKKDLYPADLESRPKRGTSDMPGEAILDLDDMLNSPEKVVKELTFCPITCLDNCRTADELKRTYRELCKSYHPNNTCVYGDLFALITEEYNRRLGCL